MSLVQVSESISGSVVPLAMFAGHLDQDTKMIVKVFASCLLAVAAASSESSSSESGSREGFRGPGLYFSPIEVDLACTAGSPLGAKLASAFETCLGGEHALKPEEVGSATERGRRRPNKGRKCPTVEQIKAKMGEGMEGDWCVLSQLGWIDEMGNENNETSSADLMSLKPEVLAELDESAMATCAQERVAMIGKMMEKKHKRCAKKFSEEDKAELMEMVHSACQKSVKGQIYAFFQAQAMAAASTDAPTTSAPVTTTAAPAPVTTAACDNGDTSC